MALTAYGNEPENRRLLGGGLSLDLDHSDQKEQLDKPAVINNGDLTYQCEEKQGKGEPDVVIELSPSITILADDVPDDSPHSEHGVAEQRKDKQAEKEAHVVHATMLEAGDEGEEQVDEDLVFEKNFCSLRVERFQEKVYTFCRPLKSFLWKSLKILLLIAYVVYFFYSLCRPGGFGDKNSIVMLGISLLIFVIVGVKFFPVRFCPQRLSLGTFSVFWGNSQCQKIRLWSRWLLRVGILVGMIILVAIDATKAMTSNLQSLVGLIAYTVVLFLFSKHPAQVNWHTVFWGIAWQWLLAVIILRTQWGLAFFNWLGDSVHTFLNHGLAGAEFVFDKEYYKHRLAFATMSVMLFFNSVIYIFFYLGVIQAIINSLGRFFAFCLETGPVESVAAAANIFVSLMEVPLMLQPFLKDLTHSELHTVMTCGFASVSGAVLGTYVQFNIPANHLLSASVMSAPAALAISKLMCPETKRSRIKKLDMSGVYFGERHSTFLQAAAAGARQAIPIIAATLANQIAFVSLLSFCNSMLEWFAARGGFSGVSFKFLCSYLFYPLVFAMGTQASDCRALAALLGIKLFGTPIMSYTVLGILRDNRQRLANYTHTYPNATWGWQGEDIVLHASNITLVGGAVSERSEVIATYMLCGFSTITSIGVCLGVLVPLMESRKSEVVGMVVSALVGGNVASFFTAILAGLLFVEKPLST